VATPLQAPGERVADPRRTPASVAGGAPEPAVGGGATGQPAVTPFRIVRQWNRVKARFPNIREQETRYGHALCVGEAQAARAMIGDPSFGAEQAATAYRWAGLVVNGALDGSLPSFEGFDARVGELAQRCLAACHPEYSPQVAGVMGRPGSTEAARREHFIRWGSVWRRLVDSADFWGRKGSRAYLAFIQPVLEQMGFDPRSDRVDFVVFTSRDGTPTG